MVLLSRSLVVAAGLIANVRINNRNADDLLAMARGQNATEDEAR